MKSILPVEWRDGFYVSLFEESARYAKAAGLCASLRADQLFPLFVSPRSNTSTNEMRATGIRRAKQVVHFQVHALKCAGEICMVSLLNVQTIHLSL